MANMALSAYTFAANPNDINVIQAYRSAAKVPTYTSVGFFSWGSTIVGKELVLEWTLMTVEQYEQLRTLYVADAQVVFDPQDGSGDTYNVEILDLDGKYFLKWGNTNALRKDVKLILLILSEVA